MTVSMKEQEVINSQLIKSATKIGKLAEAESIYADKNATISEDVVRVMKEEKIHRLIMPKEYGHPQIDFTTFKDVVKTVGYYNLSAAWLTYFFSLHNSWVAYLPRKRMDEIYLEGGLLADVLAPVGKLTRTEGGYFLSGKWNFVSGINYSTWVALGAFDYVEGGPPKRLGLCVRVSDLTIVKDWNSLGLRGSGSNTVIAENIFVPEDMIFDFADISKNRKPLKLEIDNDYLYYNTAFFPAFYIGFPAMSLGGAERMVDEYRERTIKRVRYDGTNESTAPKSQRVLAELTLKLKEAQGLMNEYIKMLETDTGQYLPGEYKGIRAKIIQNCVEIAVKVQISLGAYSLTTGDIIETTVRDLLTIGGHITSLYEDGIDSYGKALFGIVDNSTG
jgi:alkylation response protein AidB-like acyl-CoA dehydrogenase